METDFTIKVPQSANLDLKVFSSPVQISGVTGTHKVHGFSSDLRLDLAPATWQQGQSVHAKTFSGDIEVRLPESAAGTVEFDSFSGDVDSAVPLTLQSKSKRKMRASLNNAAGGEMTFKTFSGDVRLVK